MTRCFSSRETLEKWLLVLLLEFGVRIQKQNFLMNANFNWPHEFFAIMKSSLMLIVCEWQLFPLIQETIAVWNFCSF